MECLNCNETMLTINYEGTEIDRCPKCKGTWLDKGEITRIIDTRENIFSWEDKFITIQNAGVDESKETYHCPICSKSLERFEYSVNSGVIIDRCPDHHGLWLDGQELERIQITMEEYESDVRIEADKPINFFQEKKCPRCQTPLKDTEYENIPLDICPTCNGYWCDEGELTEVIKSREMIFSQDIHPEIKATAGNPNKQKTANVELLPCVICGTNMQHINYQYSSGIMIDRCNLNHGVWLDKDELEKIQVFVERWEVNSEVDEKYKQVLLSIKAESKEKWKKESESLKVSRFGFINTFLKTLANKGFF